MPDDYLTEQLARIQDDIAELKRTRPTRRSAVVTAVDTVESTFTAIVAGAGELPGIPAAASFLPAVGDTIELVLFGAVPVYQPVGVAAGAIGVDQLDPVVSSDISSAVSTANGKNTVTYAVTEPVGPGMRAGDSWFQRSAGVIVATWEWDGDSWDQRTFGDQVVDSITAGKITSGQIGVGVSIDVGDPDADHAVIDAQRLAFLSHSPDGDEVEVSRFGRHLGGIDPATGRQAWAITEAGSQSVQDFSCANDPVLMGTPFSEYIDPKAQFHAGASLGGNIDPANTGAGGGETGYYEFTVEFHPGHIYLLQSSNLWVRPGQSTTTRIDVNLRYTMSLDPDVDPSAVSNASDLYTRCAQAIHDASGTGIGQPAIIQRIIRVSKYVHVRFLCTLVSFGGSAYFEMGSANHASPLGVTQEPEAVQFWVLDLGEHTWVNRQVANSGGGGGAPAPVRRTTYTYYPNWTRRFRGNGTVHSDSADAAQGQTPYFTANGDQATQLGDWRRNGTGPGLIADLAGSTIEKFEVFLHASHWHFFDGGTAIIRYHNNVAPGSLNNYAGDVRVGGWPRGAGKWVNVTSWGNIFRDGGAKGIQVGPSGGTNPEYYGIFDGDNGAHRPAIRVTYSK